MSITVVPDRHQSPLPYWHLRFSSCWSGDKKGWLQCIFKLLALLENFSQIQLRHALQYMYFTSFSNLNRDAKSCRCCRYTCAIFFQLVLIFGPFGVIFGPFWQFGVIFGPIWAILDHFWAILGKFRSFLGHFLVLIFCGKILLCAI